MQFVFAVTILSNYMREMQLLAPRVMSLSSICRPWICLNVCRSAFKYDESLEGKVSTTLRLVAPWFVSQKVLGRVGTVRLLQQKCERFLSLNLFLQTAKKRLEMAKTVYWWFCLGHQRMTHLSVIARTIYWFSRLPSYFATYEFVTPKLVSAFVVCRLRFYDDS